jgi:hypothetical protein
VSPRSVELPRNAVLDRRGLGVPLNAEGDDVVHQPLVANDPRERLSQRRCAARGELHDAVRAARARDCCVEADERITERALDLHADRVERRERDRYFGEAAPGQAVASSDRGARVTRVRQETGEEERAHLHRATRHTFLAPEHLPTDCTAG